jgi:hypothetical protein
MARPNPKLTWCVVRLGTDLNWWVDEISDDLHWDVDGLGIIDPRQFSHILELCEPLREYGFDPDIFEQAFYSFRIEKDLNEGRVRLVRSIESVMENEGRRFALPDVMDDEKGPYADFIDKISRLRVKMLNDLIDFEQKLTIEELEDEIRERQNNDYFEGRAVHFFNEITTILEYVPDGYELDEDEEIKRPDEDEEIEGIPDFEEETIEEDETMRWDEEDEAEETEDEDQEHSMPIDDDLDDDLGDDDDDLEEDEEDEAPKRTNSRKR